MYLRGELFKKPLVLALLSMGTLGLVAQAVEVYRPTRGGALVEIGARLALLCLIIFGIQKDLRWLSSARERFFWGVLTVAVTLSLLWTALELFPVEQDPRSPKYLQDLLRIFFFACFWVSLGTRPELPDWNHNRFMDHWLHWLGGIVFATTLALYVFVLPEQYPDGAEYYPVVGLLLLSSLSGAVAFGFLAFRTRLKKWRILFRLLGLALFLASLGVLARIVFPYGTPRTAVAAHISQTLAWLVLGLFVAARDAKFPGYRSQPSAGPKQQAYVMGMAFIWFFILFLALMHVGFFESNAGAPNLAFSRRVTLFCGLFILGGIGIVQGIYSRRRQLESLKNEREMATLVKTRRELETRVAEGFSRLSETETSLREQIAKREELEYVLKKSKERFHVLVETMNEGMLIIDEHKEINYVNHALCRMLGWRIKDVVGRRLDAFFDVENQTLFEQEFEKQKQGLDTPYEIAWRHQKGYLAPSIISPRTIWNEKGQFKGSFSVVTDITDLKRAQDEMRQMAQYDPLTQLPNRLLFKERLDQAIIRGKRNKTSVAILFMDLDRFKRINDSLGHGIGDKLLQAVATRLKACVREVDTVARLSGDEFTIILTELQKQRSMDVITVVEKIQTSLGQTFSLDGFEVSITTSIGISMYPTDGTVGNILVKNADSAMYHVKTQGRNNYQFYTREMNQAALDRLTLENQLRLAMVHGQFELFFQPKIHLEHDDLVGVEVLIRWRHPEKGLVLPDKFIPLAEETGLILPIGDWVLEETCRKAKDWLDQGFRPIKFAVNLSAVQFKSETLPAKVVSALSKSNLQPESLELEITETLAMEDTEHSIGLLGHLKAMGLRIAIDDFGTGYSSLNYLRQFPIDVLKIDRCFIMGLPRESSDAAIVKAIVAIGHGMNLEVIAEGVEHHKQKVFLKNIGCDQVQGYFISRPLDFDGFRNLALQKRWITKATGIANPTLQEK